MRPRISANASVRSNPGYDRFIFNEAADQPVRLAAKKKQGQCPASNDSSILPVYSREFYLERFAWSGSS
jgi:hypothetical protein